MKKILALLLVVILTATVSISGTLAFVQASAAGIDVQTDSKKVEIDQKVYYRTYENTDSTQTCSLTERTEKSAFDLYPAIYGTLQATATTLGNYGNHNMYEFPNVQDEIVVVSNTSDSTDAYIRTWIAIECGTMPQEDFSKYITLNVNETDWDWDYNWNGNNGSEICTIAGKNYYVVLATYKSKLTPSQPTPPSLLQVMMNKEAGNAECAALDSDGDGKLSIGILTQAAQPEIGTDNGQSILVSNGISAMLNNCFGTAPPTTWNPEKT